MRRVCELSGSTSPRSGRGRPAGGAPHADPYLRRPEGLRPPAHSARSTSPGCQQQMLAGRTVAVSSLDEFPPRRPSTARTAPLRRPVEPDPPARGGGRAALGALGFNSSAGGARLAGRLVKRLQLVAQVFANALARRRLDRAAESEERLASAPSSPDSGSTRWTSERTVYVDDRFRELCGIPRSGSRASAAGVLAGAPAPGRPPARPGRARAAARRAAGAALHRVSLPAPDAGGEVDAPRGAGPRATPPDDASGRSASLRDITERRQPRRRCGGRTRRSSG